MRRHKSLCKDYENIENYEKAKADNFKNWECHHRLETHKGNTNVKGTHWFNNGEIDIRTKECPEGFVSGRLKHK